VFPDLADREATAGGQSVSGQPVERGGMDDDPRGWLFDPTTTRGLVLAHRPRDRSAVHCVVSDVVWQEVVGLLRWAAADTGGATRLDSGRWWRLATGCADLLRRLPGLSDELDEPWRPADPQTTGPSVGPEPSGTARVTATATRLAGLLRSPGPLPLASLAREIDALGAAAISALAAQTSWVVPALP
jgi:hypothetical protein